MGEGGRKGGRDHNTDPPPLPVNYHNTDNHPPCLYVVVVVVVASGDMAGAESAFRSALSLHPWAR